MATPSVAVPAGPSRVPFGTNAEIIADRVALEWRDPSGRRGCGFFRLRGGEIVFQRGCFGRLTFFRIQGIPVPASYLG